MSELTKEQVEKWRGARWGTARPAVIVELCDDWLRLRARCDELERELGKDVHRIMDLGEQVAALEAERDAFGAGLDKANHKRAVAESERDEARRACEDYDRFHHEDIATIIDLRSQLAAAREAADNLATACEENGLVADDGDEHEEYNGVSAAVRAVRAALDGLGEKA
jgi:chromosome segregation ATPase